MSVWICFDLCLIIELLTMKMVETLSQSMKGIWFISSPRSLHMNVDHPISVANEIRALYLEVLDFEIVDCLFDDQLSTKLAHI